MGMPKNGKNLYSEFKRIKKEHLLALRYRASRVVLGASVIRVFAPKTKKKLQEALNAIDLTALGKTCSQTSYKKWFERNLSELATVILHTNRGNSRIQPGYKWGHGTKILCLWVRELVLCSRYFSDEKVVRISPWLYAPIDSIAIRRLRKIGFNPPFRAINQIDTAQTFYSVQDALKTAADHVGVPRVWFDDNWGNPQPK